MAATPSTNTYSTAADRPTTNTTNGDGNFLNSILSLVNPAAGATSSVLTGILKPQTPTAVTPISFSQKSDDTLLWVVLGASAVMLVAVVALVYKLR